MHKALHPIDDVYRLYVSREEDGRRKLTSIQDSVDESIQWLYYNHQKLYRQYKHEKYKKKKNRKKLKNKQMYGHFKRQTNEISQE